MRFHGRQAVALVLCAMFLAIMPGSTVAQPGSSPGLEMTDPAGDVQVRDPLTSATLPSPATVASPVTDPFDLVSMQIVEDAPDRLVVSVGLADLAAAGRFQYLWNGGGPEVAVGFSYGEDVRYEIRNTGPIRPLVLSTATVANPPAVHETAAELCIYVGTGECDSRPAQAYVTIAASTITFVVPKSALANAAGPDARDPVAGAPDDLPAGTVFDGWRVTSTSFQYFDEMPDAGLGTPEYALQTAAANVKIAMRPPETTNETLAVPVGAEASIRLIVSNHADVRRLVNLTAQLHGDLAPGWNVRVPAYVDVPVGQTRTATVLVSAPADEPHRVPAELIVQGESAGHETEIAMARVAVESVRALAVDQTDLYFHAAEDYSVTPAIRYANVWLNALADDPLADMDEGMPFQHGSLNLLEENVVSARFDLDTSLPQGVVLDSSQPIVVTAAFSSATPVEATVFAHALADDVLVATGDTQLTVGAEPTVAEVHLPVSEDSTTLTKGSRVALVLGLRVSDPASNAGTIVDASFHPAQSAVRFPVASVVPDEALVRIAGIGLEADGDREEFGRPGAQVILPVRATNEGTEPATVALTAHADPTDWTVSFRPADRFRIEPGASIRAGVVVDVPSAASDGDVGHIMVNLTVEGLPGDSVGLSYRVIAASAAPDSPGADAFEADDETLESIVTTSADAPGGTAVALLVAIASCAVFWKRGIGRCD